MLCHELDGLQRSQGFVDISSHRKVIDSGMLHDALRIDDVEAAKGDASVLLQHAVSGGDLFCHIGKDRNLHVAKTASFAWSFDPGQVHFRGIGGCGKELTVERLEFLCPVAEGDDFGGANKGEVFGVPKENDVFSLVIFEVDLFEVAIDHSCMLMGGVGVRLKWA